MFDNLNEVEVSTTTNYLQAGVHKVRIMEFKSSEQREGYTGTPYTEFKVQNQQGIAYLKMSGADDNTSQNAIDIRKKIFAGFLRSAGVNNLNNVPLACKETLGKDINVLLCSREYWTNDKDTGMPVVKSVVDYKYSTAGDQPLQWTEKYNKTLSPSDQASYKAAHDAYIGANQNVAGSDMPF
tara:strand:+ start:1236 stop:1781 length:546 start_codon:yes stop_codon:yes gene_type:complete